MNMKSKLFAILLGLSVMGLPAIASAHPHPYRAYHRAFVAQRFHSMNYGRRQRFLGNHPYLASHRWMLNRAPGMVNPARTAKWYRHHPWAWNTGGYQGAYAAPGYGYAQPAWQHREPDADDFNNNQMNCGGDDDADDCNPGAYGYGAPGYGYGAPGYGYGNPYYGNGYGGYGLSGMLPMLQQFIP